MIKFVPNTYQSKFSEEYKRFFLHKLIRFKVSLTGSNTQSTPSLTYFEDESWLLESFFFGWTASTRASISSLTLWITPGPFTSSIGVFSSMSLLVPWVSLVWRGDLSWWIIASISSLALSKMFGAFTSFSLTGIEKKKKKSNVNYISYNYSSNCHKNFTSKILKKNMHLNSKPQLITVVWHFVLKNGIKCYLQNSILINQKLKFLVCACTKDWNFQYSGIIQRKRISMKWKAPIERDCL